MGQRRPQILLSTCFRGTGDRPLLRALGLAAQVRTGRSSRQLLLQT